MIYFLPLLAVFLGYIISIFTKPSSQSGFQLLLSFSGAFLLAVTVFELLPSVYESKGKNIGVFIMGGILLQIFLEFLSKGAEHGHTHFDENKSGFPLILLISLCIHALLEGFPLGKSDDLLHGVVIHKIPIAAILSTFLIKSNIKKFQVLLFLIVFALMTPLGSYLQLNLPTIQQYDAYFSAIVIGIFLHVSTTILFEASKNHSFNASKLLVIILGIVIAYLQ